MASRQLENTSLRPSNSIANAPTANASGASQRRDWLRRRTASSTLASSLSRIAVTRARTRFTKTGLLGVGVQLTEAAERQPEIRDPTEQAVQMRLIDDRTGDFSLAVAGADLHPVEGRRVARS
jgi:hypothetical protein